MVNLNQPVDVELLCKAGGGRTYTYRYNLHYLYPEPGEIVVVPFGSRLAPAVVVEKPKVKPSLRLPLGNAASSSFSDMEKLRPILGVVREPGILLSISVSAGRLIKKYLRSAAAAFSTWTPASFEREFKLFFFARVDISA